MGRRKYSLVCLLFLGYLDTSTALCGPTQYLDKVSAKTYGCDFLSRSERPKMIFKNEMSNGDTNYFCCSEDTPAADVKKFADTTNHCFKSYCYTKKLDGYCPTRYVKGKAHTFDEIFQEPCKDHDDKPGTSSYCCVKNSAEGQLAAAHGAEPNEFPFLARFTGTGNCGATIYNEEWVITAAHCVVNSETHLVKKPKDITIFIGSNYGSSLDQNDDYIYPVKRVIPHPEYTRSLSKFDEYGDVIAWDVALLKLGKKIEFGPTVKSLKLADVTFKPRDYADRTVIAGWGTTDLLKQSGHLQKTDLLLRDPKRCFGPTHYHPYQKYKEQLICVGGIFDGVWNPMAGEGDSGGPAVCRGSDGNAVHCGVASFGANHTLCIAKKDERNCAPSIYARVSNFTDFIQEHAGEQDENTFFVKTLYGKNVEKGYDHQVHITADGGKSCGGTLISQNAVLTAASCVADDSGTERENIKVYFGVKDLKQELSKPFIGKNVEILDGFKRVGDPVDEVDQGNRIIVTDNFYKNNLAIVKLNRKAPVPSNKLPRLPEKGEVFVKGTELALPRNPKISGKMVANEFKILDKKICQKRMNRLAKEDETMGGVGTKVSGNILCGVEEFSGGSRCDRELGGGLICKGKGGGKDVLCGVQVFRLCEWALPNAFMDVSKQIDWVTKNM